jgi:hypothetical protein
MPRLGELLVAAGLVAPEQVEQALRAQVLWGGRLGTNLIELQSLELDPLSRVLGRQHHLPAALARHFEKADPELQALLSPEIADRFSCLPLLRMGPDQHVVIAVLAPLVPGQLAIIADDLAVDVARLVPAVAAELRIRYQLERVYGIRRAARFLRARGKSIRRFPAFPILPVQAELAPAAPSLPISTREIAMYRPGAEAPADPQADLPGVDRTPTEPDLLPAAAVAAPALGDDHDDLISIEEAADEEAEEAEAPAPPADDLADPSHDTVLEEYLSIPGEPEDAAEAEAEDEALARERRHYVHTIADEPSDAERQALLGRIAIRKVAVGSAPRVMAGATLGEATRAIRRSTGRDRVADLVIDTLDRFVPACEAAILLVVRGATAVGWKGFQRAGGGLGEIALPIDDAGLVSRAVELNVTLRRASAELDPIDRLLLASLGRSDGDLVVVPIAIEDQVMCMIAIATADRAAIACAEPIAAAAAAAFARLMRDSSR